MKRIIIPLLALALCSGISGASDVVHRASTTLTNDTALLISTNTPAISLGSILVSSASPNGILLIVNSSFTINAATVALVNLNQTGMYDFKDSVGFKGLFYKTTGNANGVTIIYSR